MGGTVSTPIDCLTVAQAQANGVRNEVTRLKIGAKIALIVVVTTLLSGATGLIGVVASSQLLENQIDEKFLAVSTYTMANVHRLFLRRYQDIRGLAEDPVLRSGRASPEQITARLDEAGRHFKSYAPYSSLSYFNLDRVRIADTRGRDLGRQHSFSEYWPELAAGKAYVLNVSTSESLGDRAFHLAHVVHDGSGARIGVVVARIAVEDLREIVGRPLALFRVAGPFNVDLIDDAGLVLFSSYDSESILKARSSWRALVDKARRQGRASGTVLVDRKDGEGQDIIVFARESADASYRGHDWSLVISLPEKVALASVARLRNVLFALVAAITGMALGISFLLARTITRPIAVLTQAVTEVGKGALNTTVAIATGDELGELGLLFNQMVQDLQKLDAALKAAATVDRLTGALNRNGFEQIFEREFARANRYQSPLSLIFIDIDHFKRVNDTYGHPSGDRVLEALARVVKNNIRSTDALGRWGGEEFMLLAPGTSLQSAAKLAEKIRQRFEQSSFEGVGGVTISCGIAEHREGDTMDGLVLRADAALYAAKGNGRNRVELAATI